jgi:hypothetical protein
MLRIFLSSLLLATVTSLAEEPPKNLSIFILMGQSNMSGRGLISELKPGFPKNAPRLWMFTNAWTWKHAAESIDSDEGQIDKVSADSKSGVGPGLAFADAWAEINPSENIAVVPCAKGGSSITEWAASKSRETLYGSCLARILKAREKGVIKALLWYQGEADTNSSENAAQWPKRFTAILESLRKDLASPKLPVVYTQIARRGDKYKNEPSMQAWDQLMARQKDVHLPGVKMITADGIQFREDQLHLNTWSHMLMGKRFADALKSLSSR